MLKQEITAGIKKTYKIEDINRVIKKELQNTSGIYVLYNNPKKKDRTCIYVGKSSNVYARLQTHMSKNNSAPNYGTRVIHNMKREFIKTVDVYFSSNNNLNEFESFLINKLNPIFNTKEAGVGVLYEIKENIDSIYKNIKNW